MPERASKGKAYGRASERSRRTAVALPPGFPCPTTEEWRRLTKAEKQRLEAVRAAEAVRQVRDHGQAPVEVAQAMGVNKSRVYAWCDAAGLEREPRRGRGVVMARDGGQALRAARASAGLTQIALDRAAGISESTVCRLEGTAEFAITRDKAVRIAAVLDLDLDTLFEPLLPRKGYDRRTRTCEPMPPTQRAFAAITAWQEGADLAERYRAEAGLHPLEYASKALGRAPHSISRLAAKLNLGQRLAPQGKPGSKLLLSDSDLTRLRDHITASNVASLHEDPEARADWYLSRHNSTTMYGRNAKPIAEKRNNKVGRESHFDRPDLQARLRELDAKRFSQQRIANILSREFDLAISRDQVKRALRKLGETPL